jgi:hypothetical protein
MVVELLGLYESTLISVLVTEYLSGMINFVVLGYNEFTFF